MIIHTKAVSSLSDFISVVAANPRIFVVKMTQILDVFLQSKVVCTAFDKVSSQIIRFEIEVVPYRLGVNFETIRQRLNLEGYSVVEGVWTAEKIMDLLSLEW